MSDERPAWLSYHNKPLAGGEYVNPTTRPAEHERGILFRAPWEDPFSGFPEHARRLVRSLVATGEVVRLRALRGSFDLNAGARDPDMRRARDAVRAQLREQLRCSVKSIDAEVVMTVADDAALMRFAPAQHHWMTREQNTYALQRRVISTVFERDRLSPQAVDALQRVGQVWVANDQDADMLREHGLTRVRVVPIPFMRDDPHLTLPRTRMPGPTRFYHIGKWEPRKEQRHILGAFLRAFSPGAEAPRLYLKTSAKGPKLTSGYPESPQQALRELLDEPEVAARGWSWDNVNGNVFVIQRRLTDRQMVGLHMQGDVYVTLSRGEGFDMPAYDAKLSGNRMIYTPSGGPQDFAAPSDWLVPATGKVPCDPFYDWAGASYLDYDLDAAVEAMQLADEVVQDGETVERGSPDPRRFGAEAVGRAMARALEEVRDD
jgi:hypothetical protein